MEVMYAQNDNLLRVLGLRDGIANTYLNNATVEVSLKDSAGQDVAGQTWPLQLTYVVGSNGDYFGILSHDLSISEGEVVQATIIVNGGEGLYGQWESGIRVSDRPF